MRKASCLLVVVLAGICGVSVFARTPTNDASAYRRFDLYADRTAAVNVVDHQNVSVYPAFLDSDALLIVRSAGDTVGLFDSEPYDGINLKAEDATPVSYVEYSVTPRQYASSIGLLVMAYNVFNGPGEFDDLGKRLLTVLVTYEDGDTTLRAVRVGYHVRDWASGIVYCPWPFEYQFYIVPPSDPLAGVVWSDDVNGWYFDILELRLPGEKRGKKAATIRLSAEIQDHYCSNFVPHI